jgi:hypothetical protein
MKVTIPAYVIDLQLPVMLNFLEFRKWSSLIDDAHHVSAKKRGAKLEDSLRLP